MKIRTLFRTIGRILLIVLALLAIWIAIDVYVPRKSDIRQFDPVRVGQLETDMWRAYYEHKPGVLFLRLGETLRSQFRAPFWRSYLLAWHAAKAALTFQKGKNRTEYALALPYLEKYYSGINGLCIEPFDVRTVARNELEWWIIRREPDQHTPDEWEQLIAENAAEVYRVDPEKTLRHAVVRVQAMLLRDNKRERIEPEDWLTIEKLLKESWYALYQGVNEQK